MVVDQSISGFSDEIEKCFKKVSDSAESFEIHFKKLQNAESVNQKDNYHNDLQKEMKKLQVCQRSFDFSTNLTFNRNTGIKSDPGMSRMS